MPHRQYLNQSVQEATLFEAEIERAITEGKTWSPLARPALEYAPTVWDPFYAKDTMIRGKIYEVRLLSLVTNVLEQLELEPVQLHQQVARQSFFSLPYNSKIGLCTDMYIIHAGQLRSTRLNHSVVLLEPK